MSRAPTNQIQRRTLFTSEEERVPIYSETELPTLPSEVNQDTRLESLNLNWREKDLPERDRTKHVHRLHPYLGKFVPQLAEIFLRKYFKPKQTVLDPFCGSGTTLVQANELAIHALGYDISAFNVLLSRAKTRKYDVRKVRSEVLDSLAKLRRLTYAGPQLRLLDERLADLSIPEPDSKYLQEWYAPKALHELLTYRHFIQSEAYTYTDLLKIILSRSARSARLTTHYDLDFPKRPQTQPYWCYKHSRTCHPTTEALKFINRYSIDTLRRIEEYAALRTNASVEVRHADSRRATFPPIDGVITSPPYVGLINYHDQHAYAYHLLGLKDRRDAEIGPAVNGSGYQAKKQYQLDIARVFRRVVQAMPPGGPLVVVVHDSANLYPEIAALCGVQEVATLHRHVNRRTGRRSSEFYESVFIWRKP
jgi:DNA modification methylase